MATVYRLTPLISNIFLWRDIFKRLVFLLNYFLINKQKLPRKVHCNLLFISILLDLFVGVDTAQYLYVCINYYF
jgi:hypothetical protein